MPTYDITVVQEFTCTYRVRGRNEADAFDSLLSGGGEPVGEQFPDGIVSTFEDAEFEVASYDGAFTLEDVR